MPQNYNTTDDQAKFQLISQKMLELHNIFAGMGQEIVSYTDNELRGLKSQIEALDPDGVSTAISRINAFLEANDADGNNVIDALPGLISSISSLENRVSALESDNTANKSRLSSLENVQGQQGNSITALQGDAANHKSRIEALEAREDDAGLSESEVEGIAVAQDRKLLDAVANAMNVAFTSFDLGKTFPITGAPAGGTGGVA